MNLKQIPLLRMLNKYRILYREKKKAYRNKKELLQNIQAMGNKYPDKTICLIYRLSEKTGLFSDVITFLGRIKEAVDNGWEPVIDMQNYPNMYLQEDQIGIVNAWEFFFEQPFGIGVTEALESSRVIKIGADGAADYPFASAGFLYGEYGKLEMWRRYVHEYVQIRTEIQEEIERKYHAMIGEQDKVCGVLVRGSDYTTMRPKGHPIQPTIPQVIQKVTEVAKEYGCNKIYLSTEEQKTVDEFKKVFGINLLYLDKTYIDYRGGYLADAKIVRDRKTGGIEYLTQIAILAKCDCIVAGVCSGTLGAALLSEGYEYEYYWNLGYY